MSNGCLLHMLMHGLHHLESHHHQLFHSQWGRWWLLTSARRRLPRERSISRVLKKNSEKQRIFFGQAKPGDLPPFCAFLFIHWTTQRITITQLQTSHDLHTHDPGNSEHSPTITHTAWHRTCPWLALNTDSTAENSHREPN
jgi:hypothetical protein